MDIYRDKFYYDFRDEYYETIFLAGDTEDEWLYYESFDLTLSYLEE